MNQLLLLLNMPATGASGGEGTGLLFRESPMVALPLWFIFLATVAIALLFIEVGYRLGLYRRKSLEDEDKKQPVAEIVAAILGLLAFMLGFTFNLAANRYDERRVLVTEEANAMGTTYLRAGLLPEPLRSETRKLLRDDLQLHIEAVRPDDMQPEKIQQDVARVEELHNQLWTLAETASAKNQGSVAVGLFIYSLNNMIDLFARRVTLGLRTHIPSSIWASLYLISICAMAILGFHGGLAKTRRFTMVIPLVLAFSIVILLIAGLDRPMAGLVKVSQQPLIELQRSWDVEDARSKASAAH